MNVGNHNLNSISGIGKRHFRMVNKQNLANLVASDANFKKQFSSTRSSSVVLLPSGRLCASSLLAASKEEEGGGTLFYQLVKLPQFDKKVIEFTRNMLLRKLGCRGAEEDHHGLASAIIVCLSDTCIHLRDPTGRSSDFMYNLTTFNHELHLDHDVRRVGVATEGTYVRRSCRTAGAETRYDFVVRCVLISLAMIQETEELIRPYCHLTDFIMTDRESVAHKRGMKIWSQTREFVLLCMQESRSESSRESLRLRMDRIAFHQEVSHYNGEGDLFIRDVEHTYRRNHNNFLKKYSSSFV
jgi:hypothetical protein